MRVFAITHILSFCHLHVEGAREIFVAAWDHGAKIICNSTIIASGVLIGLDREIKTSFQASGALIFLHLLEDACIVASSNHYVDEGVVFGRRSDHGRAANINVFYRVF